MGEENRMGPFYHHDSLFSYNQPDFIRCCLVESSSSFVPLSGFSIKHSLPQIGVNLQAQFSSSCFQRVL